MKSSILVFTAAVAVLAGCTASKTSNNEFSKFGFTDAIYTTRSETINPIITLVKLKNPALLETAERKDGKLVVDAALAKAIQDEQTATIASLQKISPDIRVLIRYKLVLNALAIYAPADTYEKIRSLPNVILSEKSTPFSRPQDEDAEEPEVPTHVGANTSVNFIGADAAYAQNIHGEGMRIGVIDTGIDYTHKMLTGEGTVDAYKANQPASANAAFPNKKVVGGIDFVGTAYDAASPDFTKHIPVPDMNPIDEAGHGTHVAGTIAGIGDGVGTYSGVAPAAELYALKVFGANGSTSDEAVIAALEFAADPNGDLSFTNQLDVVNLSLGSDYGNPHQMYAHAIKNLVRGGTMVVASAGNSGDKKYVVGAPSTTEESISVAATIDNMDQNLQFAAAVFSAGAEEIKADMVEGAVTKQLSKFPEVKGDLIAVGTANEDFDQATKDQIKGKIALIDRGVKSFIEKILRAQAAGAIAVVMVNNDDEEPFLMGGDLKEDEKIEIPGIMITKKVGAALKEKLKAGVVAANLKSDEKIVKPWLTDTMASFSSRGPRSEDGLIKPEISSPGSNIISAAFGKGDKGTLMSGTSMAGPHITGVMALLKQKFKDATPAELKSVLMGHGKLIADKDKKQYPISRQGAGRVQVAESLEAKIVTIPAALSLGITDIEKQKTVSQQLTVKNISQETITMKPVWNGTSSLQISVEDITLAAGESKTVLVMVKATTAAMKSSTEELEGFLSFATEKTTLVQIPTMMVARKISQIKATSLKVHATSLADSASSVTELTIKNFGLNAGTAQVFNLLGKDSRKNEVTPDYSHNRNCDMQSAGYRIIEKDGARVLQVAVKLYERMTTWNTCEVNVQIDGNGDGQTDQEIAGVPQSSLPGLIGDKFVSLLLDGTKAREIRKKYEADLAEREANKDKDKDKDKDDKAKDKKKKKEIKEDYTTALQDLRTMQVFDGSTLAIIEADVSELAVAGTGELNIKVSTTHQDSSAVEIDDYLGQDEVKWEKISLNPMAQSFVQIPEKVELKAQETTTLQLQKGYGTGSLILYVPENRSVVDVLLEDSQSQVVPATFGE